MPVDDFAVAGDTVCHETNGSKGAAKGIKRPWLKSFETPPAQMLSAYGVAKFVKMSDEDVSVMTVSVPQVRLPSTTSPEYRPGNGKKGI